MALIEKTVGGKSVDGSSNAYWFYLEVTLNSQNMANNTSNITIKHYGKTAGSYSFEQFSTPRSIIKLYDTNSGTTTTKQTTKVTAITSTSYVKLGEWTGNVTHKTDGTLSITVTATFDPDSTTWYLPAETSVTSSATALPSLHKPPAITNLVFTENNSTLVNAGVAGNTIVPYLSNKTATITATLYDSASVSSTTIKNGSKSFSGTSLSVGVNLTNQAVDYVTSNNLATFSATVKDSKNGSSSKNFTFTVIPYVLPSLSSSGASVKRNGQTTGKVNLSFTGSFYNGSVGNISNNITLSYAYWKVGETESTSYITIPSSAYTKSGNSITMTDWAVANNGTIITNVLSTSNYNFKIRAVDSLGKSSTITLVCPSGEYLMAKFKDRVDFKKITINGKELHPIGSVVITSTNVSPASDFGGTWTLIDKEFSPKNGGLSCTNNSGSLTAVHSRWGHINFVRIQLQCNASMNDSTITWGKYSVAEMGVSELSYQRYGVYGADGANGLGLFDFGIDGTISSVDMNSKSGASSLASDAYFSLWLIDVAIPGNMLDAHCNKFYWKRTA